MDNRPEQNFTQVIAGLDRVVHEPARLMVMAILSVVNTADFVFLQRQTGLVGGNLSSHMSRLEEAGYVEVEKTFVDRVPRTLYHLTDAGKTAFQAYRRNMIQALETLPVE